MTFYYESELTDEDLDDSIPMDAGVHLLETKSVTVGTSESKKDGAEYEWWRFGLESVTGPSKGQRVGLFISFDKTESLAPFMQLKRRAALRALGIRLQLGARIELPDPNTLMGRFVKATVKHWHNPKRDRLEAQIEEIEQHVKSQQQPQQSGAEQSGRPDEIPF